MNKFSWQALGQKDGRKEVRRWVLDHIKQQKLLLSKAKENNYSTTFANYSNGYEDALDTLKQLITLAYEGDDER